MAHYHCNICDSLCGADECKEVYFGGREGFILRPPVVGGQLESFVCHECLDRLREILTPAVTQSAEAKEALEKYLEASQEIADPSSAIDSITSASEKNA